VEQDHAGYGEHQARQVIAQLHKPARAHGVTGRVANNTRAELTLQGGGIWDYAATNYIAPTRLSLKKHCPTRIEIVSVDIQVMLLSQIG
jgi:hypothetical protein